MLEPDFNALGLFNCEPEEIIALLKFGADSDVALYPFLQSLTVEDFVVAEELGWNEFCGMGHARYQIASSEIVLRLESSQGNEKALYIIEVNIKTLGRDETTRYVFETLEEAERGFQAQQKQLQIIFPDCADLD